MVKGGVSMRLVLAALGLLLFTVTACAPRPAAQAPPPAPAPGPIPKPAAPEFKLKAVGISRPTAQFKLLEWLGEELARRTDGRVTVEVVSLPELGLTGFEMVRVLRPGLVDIADVASGYVAGDFPLIEGVDLPGLFREFETYELAFSAWLKVLKGYEEKLGIVFLGGIGWPKQVVMSRKPIRDLSDLKGMKIRVWGSALADYVKALGAEPVSLPIAEVYTALERGTIDGVITGTENAVVLKLYEVAKYMVDTGMGPVLTLAMVSKRTWDKLPPDIRKVLEELGPELTKKAFELSRESTDRGIKGAVEKGMEWVPMKPEWEPVRKEVVQHVLARWAKRAGPEGKKAFNEVLAPLVGFSIP